MPNDWNPAWPTQDRALARAAAELLEAGEYERLAELLERARAAHDRQGEAIPAQTLDLARRICLACSQSQAEAEWHQQARAEAAQREDELRQQLNTLLDLTDGRERSPDAPSAPEPPSLRQRLYDLLHWRPGPLGAGTPPSPSPQAEAPPPPAREAVHEAGSSPRAAPDEKQEARPPSLIVYCLGQFRVYQDEQPVEDWPSGKGKAIFKYLVTHRERPVVKEVLMELFWPGAHPDAARNNLNVALYGLRQALRAARPDFSHVLFQDDCYLLNCDLRVWIDAEEFGKHFRLAQEMEKCDDQAAAIREYHAAEALYDGEFLEEDRYEDWLIPRRQRYQDDYLKLLDCLSRCYLDNGDYARCVTMCRKMLTVDPCREEAHRRLMRSFNRQGQRYLALRQYHLCAEILKEELDVPPSQETMAIYQRVRNARQT